MTSHGWVRARAVSALLMLGTIAALSYGWVNSPTLSVVNIERPKPCPRPQCPPTATFTSLPATTVSPAPTTSPIPVTVQPTPPTNTAVPQPTPTPLTTPVAAGRAYGLIGQGQMYEAANPSALTAAYNAGVRLRLVELEEDQLETNDPAKYAVVQSKIDAFLAAGADTKLILDLGLQYPSARLQGMDRMVDQYGRARDSSRSTGGGINVYWSPSVRAAVAVYIQQVFTRLNFHGKLWAVRVGPFGGEMMFPELAGPDGGQSFWAYDSYAQAAVPSAVRGWRPGQPSPNGEARTFWLWYADRVADTFGFLAGEVRRYYAGYIAPVTPGLGFFDASSDHLITTNLRDATWCCYGTGAYWQRLYPAFMPGDSAILAWHSSLGDATGTDEGSADIGQWSSAHLAAWYAQQIGRPIMGENPGRNAYTAGQCGADGRTTMLWDFDALRLWGYKGLIWVRESDFGDACFATLDQYGTQINQNTPVSQIYWGALIYGDTYGLASNPPWDMTAANTFEAHAGKGMSIFSWGAAWYSSNAWPNGYYPFLTYLFDNIRARGSIPLFTWGSFDTGGAGPSFSLSSIIAGNHDAYITQWATAARDWDHPFFLRWGWEMNGNWYPWSELTPPNSSGQYVQAWRHIHDIFTAVGATNVTWVWCVNIVEGGSIALNGLYPGAAYVDWVAMDGYNWGTNPSHPYGWKTFAQTYAQTYAALGTLAPGKPIMIAEVASSEYGGSKAGWITDALGTQLRTNYPLVKAVVWFNRNDDNMDWVIETSAGAQAAFASGIASSYYALNSFANIGVSPIPPLVP